MSLQSPVSSRAAPLSAASSRSSVLAPERGER